MLGFNIVNFLANARCHFNICVIVLENFVYANCHCDKRCLVCDCHFQDYGSSKAHCRLLVDIACSCSRLVHFYICLLKACNLHSLDVLMCDKICVCINFTVYFHLIGNFSWLLLLLSGRSFYCCFGITATF